MSQMERTQYKFQFFLIILKVPGDLFSPQLQRDLCLCPQTFFFSLQLLCIIAKSPIYSFHRPVNIFCTPMFSLPHLWYMLCYSLSQFLFYVTCTNCFYISLLSSHTALVHQVLLTHSSDCSLTLDLNSYPNLVPGAITQGQVIIISHMNCFNYLPRVFPR